MGTSITGSAGYEFSSAEGTLGCAAVLACVRNISETMAALPLHLYKRAGERTKEKASDHPLYKVLSIAPNPEMTAFEAKEIMLAQCLVRGNSYWEKVKNKYGQVMELWPMWADRVTPTRDTITNQIVYGIEINGKWFQLSADRVLHIRGFSSRGLIGLVYPSVVKDAIGMTKAQEEYAGKFYKNDATPSGHYKHPLSLSDEGVKRFRGEMEKMHGGLAGKHRFGILEEGMTFEVAGISPKDSELIAGRQFQLSDIARIFRIPPHKIQDLSRATFSNIEEQSIEWVVDTLSPWAARIESRLNFSCLAEDEQEEFFTKFALEGLLRGNSAARSAFYREMFNVGAFSINDIRELEDLDEIGEAGDVHFVPMNIAPVERALEPPKPPPAPIIAPSQELEPDSEEEPESDEEEPDGEPVRSILDPIIRDTAERIARADTREVAKILARAGGVGPRHEELMRAHEAEFPDVAVRLTQALRDAVVLATQGGNGNG